jgi:general secretion pathway protein C
MWARWSTFSVWALVAASVLFWGMKLFVSPSPAPTHAQVAEVASTARADLARLLGAEAPPPAQAAPVPDARFQLIGVVTPRAAASAREGLALIAVDGKPPKAFRVGAVIEGETVLKSVAARGATLGPREGAAVVALALAPPPAAATGMLPAAGGTRAAPTLGAPGVSPPMPPAIAPGGLAPPRRITRQPEDGTPAPPPPTNAAGMHTQ